MGGSSQVIQLCAAAAAVLGCLAAHADAPTSTGAESWRARVSTKLQAVYDARQQPASSSTSATSLGNALIAARAARFDDQGRVQADVHYNCSAKPPTSELVAAGLHVGGTTRLPPLCVVEGWATPAALPKIAAVASVTRLTLPSYARRVPHPSQKSTAASSTSTTIDANGLTIMHADQFVTQAGGGGGGVTVGVQSLGIASLSIIQGRHELPNVSVFTSAAGGTNSSGADEGTVLLEEVHAVAPNAGLAFCEPQTFVEYTACLQQFAKAGATVMVDDILFLEQDPMSSSDTDTQAIEQFLAQNLSVLVFTAAGNDNGSYWEGSYTPVTVASQGQSTMTCTGSTQVDSYVNQFGTGVQQILTITTTSAISVPFTFAWADPPGQNTSNFDVYWNNQTDSTKSGCVSTAGSTGTVVSKSITLYPGNNIVWIATPDASLAGKFLKLWVGGDGLTALSLPTQGSLVSPQAFASGVITIGAVKGSDGIGNNIEAYSGRGPIKVSFPSPAQIQAPIFVAPDGINVDATGTYFSSDLFPDGNFYGTSAAAPNAAAVAALIWGAFPNLTPAEILTALQNGATQLGAAPPDGTFGYGRIDALGAVNTLPGPTITSLPDVTIDASTTTTSASIPVTISGTGTIHFTATSTNSALIPATVTSTTAPGITIPAGCGSTTLTCTLTVTAAQYQGGTATVTLSAIDGAGRSAPATMHVTVNNPQTAPATAVATGSKGGGGSMGLLEDLCLAELLLLSVHQPRRLRYSRASSLSRAPSKLGSCPP